MACSIFGQSLPNGRGSESASEPRPGYPLGVGSDWQCSFLTVPKGTAMMEYRQIQVIGGKGSAPGQFAASLRSLAVDTHGQLYAAGDSDRKSTRLNSSHLGI